MATIKHNQEIIDQRSKVLEEKRNATSRISDSCRVVGFGLLAIFYSIRVGGVDMEKIGTAHPFLVWAVGVFGFLSILFDYLQYASAARAVETALEAPDHKYDPNSLPYKLRRHFYAAKQWAVVAGVISLGLLFVFI